jgi:hypothetical protein
MFFLWSDNAFLSSVIVFKKNKNHKVTITNESKCSLVPKKRQYFAVFLSKYCLRLTLFVISVRCIVVKLIANCDSNFAKVTVTHLQLECLT